MKHSDSTPPSLPRSFWIAGVISVGLAVAGGIWHASKPGPGGAPLSFPPLQIDADKLEEIQAQRDKRVGDLSEDPRIRTFLETVREVNVAQFEQTAGNSDDDAKSDTRSAYNSRLTRKLEAHATDVIPVTDWADFIAAGTPVFDACRAGLKRVMNAVDSGDLSSDSVMNGRVPDTYEKYRNNCGHLFPALVRRRLVTKSGSWRSPDAPSLFELSQRYRWASIIDRLHSPWEQLHPYERRVFLRWRIETPEAFSAKARLRSIDIAEDYLSDYPVNFARALVAWDQGDRRSALKYLRRAHAEHGNSDRIARALRWVEATLDSEQ